MTVSLEPRWLVLIEKLVESDRASNGNPQLSAGSREDLVNALEEIVADSSLAAQYRRDLRALCPQGFPHLDELGDETVERCLTRGLNELTDVELARLPINPLAMLQLQEALLDDDFADRMPDVWWDVFDRVGSRRMAEAGLTLPPIESLTRASADQQEADGDESFVTPAVPVSQADRPAAAKRGSVVSMVADSATDDVIVRKSKSGTKFQTFSGIEFQIFEHNLPDYRTLHFPPEMLGQEFSLFICPRDVNPVEPPDEGREVIPVEPLDKNGDIVVTTDSIAALLTDKELLAIVPRLPHS